MAPYLDLREYLVALEANDKLFRVSQPVIKETELSPFVRLQYRGLPEEKRRGFLFEDVRGINGKKFKTKVAAGIYASSTQIYALGLACKPSKESISQKWQQGLIHPIEATMVSSGPVQEVIVDGKDVGSEMENLPVPVEVPGFSGQIRTTTQFITKDPKTEIRNMGNYSGHIFGPSKVQWEIDKSNHGRIHWDAWKSLGKPMPAAIVIGGPPILFYVAAAKIPYGVDELAVAGGMTIDSLQLVKCKTVDLEVPAQAEIILEGLVSTEYMEPGNAYGEYTGYMSTDVYMRPVMEITCVTRKQDPIFVHVVSQFPPSESSKVRNISLENLFYKFLSTDCKIPGILDVAWHEISQGQWCVIRIRKTKSGQPWQVLQCASGFDTVLGKYFIVVDEDIDARDLNSVIWALSWRVQPGRDIRIIHGRMPALDPSAFRPNATYEEKEYPNGIGSSAMLIDATLKYPYPPVSLPKREFMERALEIWKASALPQLALSEPWYGYSLGYWPEEYDSDAKLVAGGEHFKVGDRLEKKRAKA